MSQSVDIKTTMYEGLSKAVQLNSNIVPHVLQFLETQFRNIFVGGEDATTLEIQPTHIVRDQNGGILICENLGQLIQLIGTCLIIASKFQIDCDNVFLKEYFESVFDHIDSVKMSDLGVGQSLDTKTVVLGGQFIQALEAFMAYGIYQCSSENNYLNRILTLFKYRNECVEEMKV
jgi:FANCI helical domain 2